MKKHIQWLLTEIEIWIQEGIISPEQARTLKQRYEAQSASPGWGRMIFSIFGAVLLGLGVILFFAYNWEDMHRYVKLALIGVGLGAFHGTALALRGKPGIGPQLPESLHIAGTMMFGAGIWLVAQIYHIDEHFPNAFLVWGLGATALAWALPSVAQAMLAVVLLSFWNGIEVFQFYDPQQIAPFLILAASAPLAWRLRSRALMALTLSTWLLNVWFTVFQSYLSISFHVVFLIAWSMAAFAVQMEKHESFALFAPLTYFIGRTPFLIMLYALTFRHSAKHVVNVTTGDLPDLLYLIGACFVTLWAAFTELRPLFDLNQLRSDEMDIERIVSSAFMIVFVLFLIPHDPMKGWSLAVLFNFTFLFHALYLIYTGSRSARLSETAQGCFMFGVLAFSRFGDLFDSLIERSIVFLAVGAALFIAGNRYNRSKRNIQEAQP